MMANPSEATERPPGVVIAEDELLLRTLAVEDLEEAGFRTFEAENALAALDICKARSGSIDVLFTDIRMPGSMDGLELAHRVRERWPGIAIIIVSGNIFVSRDELPEGARFLPKPYDMRRIVDMVRQAREVR
jgi:DNA-binding NtrC family response regulator